MYKLAVVTNSEITGPGTLIELHAHRHWQRTFKRAFPLKSLSGFLLAFMCSFTNECDRFLALWTKHVALEHSLQFKPGQI